MLVGLHVVANRGSEGTRIRENGESIVDVTLTKPQPSCCVENWDVLTGLRRFWTTVISVSDRLLILARIRQNLTQNRNLGALTRNRRSWLRLCKLGAPTPGPHWTSVFW
ncbi:unnamed protein product [Pieris brassicae]|uniref:Uncharacterized protein n=1 Tax=Pieris brassicae TaxID=7116 RepID=A0A9P0TPS8_PIEBR|nr:unnamed protein product [Pieris brassicae]